MKNESGIHPVGHHVLVLPEQETEDEAKLKKIGLVMPGSINERHRLAQMAGVVVEIGRNSWIGFAGGWIMRWLGFNKPWARVGDRVMFAKYSGVVLRGKDGKSYRMVNDEDIVAVLDNEVEVKSGDDA